MDSAERAGHQLFCKVLLWALFLQPPNDFFFLSPSFFSFLSSGHVFAAIAAAAPLANHGAPEAPGVLICF